MYKYYIDTSTTDDIKRYFWCMTTPTNYLFRYQNKSHYKLVTSLVDDSTHSITALSCINEFHSCIQVVIATTSSKTGFRIFRFCLIPLSTFYTFVSTCLKLLMQEMINK